MGYICHIISLYVGFLGVRDITVYFEDAFMLLI